MTTDRKDTMDAVEDKIARLTHEYWIAEANSVNEGLHAAERREWAYEAVHLLAQINCLQVTA